MMLPLLCAEIHKCHSPVLISAQSMQLIPRGFRAETLSAALNYESSLYAKVLHLRQYGCLLHKTVSVTVIQCFVGSLTNALCINFSSMTIIFKNIVYLA